MEEGRNQGCRGGRERRRGRRPRGRRSWRGREPPDSRSTGDQGYTLAISLDLRIVVVVQKGLEGTRINVSRGRRRVIGADQGETVVIARLHPPSRGWLSGAEGGVQSNRRAR